MSKEFDKRFKELYDQNCDPGPYHTLNPNLWYPMILKVWQEIELPKIILGAFDELKDNS